MSGIPDEIDPNAGATEWRAKMRARQEVSSNDITTLGPGIWKLAGNPNAVASA